jgi:hypothetical protein
LCGERVWGRTAAGGLWPPFLQLVLRTLEEEAEFNVHLVANHSQPSLPKKSVYLSEF